MLLCLSTGGFLVSEPKVYWQWFETINFFTFAYTASVLVEFEGLELFVGNETVDGLAYVTEAGEFFVFLKRFFIFESRALKK